MRIDPCIPARVCLLAAWQRSGLAMAASLPTGLLPQGGSPAAGRAALTGPETGTAALSKGIQH
jgi:hypothetical protein